ncbi:MAG: hypothetical protein ILO36_06415 [Abditibacteriota bacterium]|nr:hypothetical protein [Abditibacteriota bacterium]
MKKILSITIAFCLLITAAAVYADKVGIFKNGKLINVVDEKGIAAEDCIGNKPKKTNGISVPREHVPDVRIYSTTQYKFTDYILYSHSINYGFDDSSKNGGWIFGGNDNSGDAFDHFAFLYLKEPRAFEKEYAFLGKTEQKDGLSLEKYDIKDAVSEYDKRRMPEGFTIGRNHPIMPLAVLKDGNIPVWASGKFRFLGAEKRGEGYIVIHNKGVEYINPENGIMVSHYYCKTFASDFDFDDPSIGSPVISAEMLTDNIVRIEYRNGDVIHFRVRLTKEDCDKNLKSKENGSADNDLRAKGCIVWHSKNCDKALSSMAWDLNKDTSAEPSYSD